MIIWFYLQSKLTMKKIAKVKKDKPYRPYLLLLHKTDGEFLVQTLGRASWQYEEACQINTKIVRDFALVFAETHTKKLIWGNYPLKVSLKKYEAMLLYKALLRDHSKTGYSNFFDFIWEIDQNLMV